METLSQTFAERKPPLYKRMFKSLGFWVIVGIVAGIVLGYVNKEMAIASKPGVDYFISALKVLIGPIIFVTLVLGIISLESLKKVGSIGAKAVIYFEVVSTLALALGIFMANIMQPGHGMNLDPKQLDTTSVQKYISQTTEVSASSEIMHILQDAMPRDIITPFTEGKTMQVLVIAIITALIISLMRIEDRQAIQRVLEVIQNFVFKILQVIMYFSPVAAFSAMAVLIAQYGLGSLINLAYLLLVMLVSCLIFIFGILGLICYFAKVNIFKFMRFISREVLIVFATSSSESALAPLMRKLEKAGLSKATVGLVLPIGVTGSGFIVLGSTLAALGNMEISEANTTLAQVLPVAAIGVLLGVDKFMSEMRAVGNLCGNSVAALIVAIWDKQIDWEKFRYALDNPEKFHNAGMH
ncbi:cation:dicarboxylase symporter family transporter [Campylobacter coli]|nr:cation:dicarboxylase symporter family transporter [Campylobacter coli]EJP2858369.1 cation:dicarboxylase symporter family transporter [Campylobacter coli]EJP2860018.1 cation:dicarboxylase symporter family transporter [Campylobacter coli]